MKTSANRYENSTCQSLSPTAKQRSVVRSGYDTHLALLKSRRVLGIHLPIFRLEVRSTVVYIVGANRRRLLARRQINEHVSAMIDWTLDL